MVADDEVTSVAAPVAASRHGPAAAEAGAASNASAATSRDRERPTAGTLEAGCVCIAITRRRRRSATRRGRPWSRSFASASATPPSPTPRGVLRGPASTPHGHRRPRRSATRELDVIFTGGGSEADNLAVLGRLSGGGRVVTTPLEHPAVARALAAAADETAVAASMRRARRPGLAGRADPARRPPVRGHLGEQPHRRDPAGARDRRAVCRARGAVAPRCRPGGGVAAPVDSTSCPGR